MAKRLHIGIIFGGRSGEHEISLRSAHSVVAAIDRDKYDVTLIGIDHDGGWHRLEEAAFFHLTASSLPKVTASGAEVVLRPRPAHGELIDATAHGIRARGVRSGVARPGGKRAVPVATRQLDVVFPILHGTFGEDGSMQGLLDLADVAYVGSGVLGSAVGMDKDVQKRLLQAAGIPVLPYFTATRRQWAANAASLRAAADKLGYPLFVKPANLGSSVGITKVNAKDRLAAAIEIALQYDTKILVEHGIDAREIEVAVLGNEDAQASLPGEVCPAAEFYSYTDKYVNEHGAALKIPAPLTAAQTKHVRALAVRVFQLLECSGMARVDFFLERSTKAWYANEVNTIPGFTSISMYPKLWEASGISYRDLISQLIDLALARHAERRRLKRTFDPS